MQIHALDGIARETPNGRISANVVGSTRHFSNKPTSILTHSPTTKEILSDPAIRVLFMRITLIPFELKKELCRIKERPDLLLANEIVDNAADDRLDMNKGWSCSQIIEQDNFLEIMQQGLSYFIEGTEIFFNHVIYFFLHHGILHLAHLEIELGLLVFDDHPTEHGVKVVLLKEHTRTRTVTENDHKHEEKITEKIIPVKFKAYPLETVTGAGKATSKIPLHSGMVALIVLMQKLAPIFKSASEMKAIRVKMMAIRAAMKIGIPLNTIQKEGTKSQRGDEAENQDKYDHGSKPEEDGFKRKKAKLSGLLGQGI
jgi:hypothetical protein